MGSSLLAPLVLLAMASMPRVEPSGESDLMYLLKFGYMDNTEKDDGLSAMMTDEGIKQKMREAVMDFQAFAGLEQTGEVDRETKVMMQTPRCGMKDVVGQGSYAKRKKRYVLQGSKWTQREVTWKVIKFTSKLDKQDQLRTIRDSFQLWQDKISNVRFREVPPGSDSKVDIEISWTKAEHGDGNAFDGRGGTLAHAYFPVYGGDVHMDDAENWTLKSHRGTDMYQTMVHELGHSLGLSHSKERSAIMAPFHKGYIPNMELDRDDILAIQELYGRHEDPHDTTLRPGTGGGGRGKGNICSGRLDAIFMTEDKSSYVFIGSEYWKLSPTAVEYGPKQISRDWQGLEADIDAAFTYKDNSATYFFKGNQYWKFKNQRASPGYPKDIQEGFPGIPANLDAAFLSAANNMIYFFKGDEYWRFEPKNRPHIQKHRYPKSITKEWGGLPAHLSSAFLWNNGKNYFFKDGQYYRFSETEFRVEQPRRGAPYPRNTGKWWFGCPS